MGLLLALCALVVYTTSNPVHYNQYNHFVWQAAAFLDGRVWIPFPVHASDTSWGNDYLQDVYPLVDGSGAFTNRVLLPFPPLPAIVLLPFVAVFGLATDQEAIAIGLGAGGVLAAWWMLGGLRISLRVRALTTLVFATGTAWWWATAVGTTWYLAHIVAVIFAFLAVGIALRRDRGASDAMPWDDDDDVAAGRDTLGRRGGPEGGLARLRDAVWPLDGGQVLAGLLLGIAATARLPVVFAAPFFMLVGGGGSVVRRTLAAGIGGALPVAALLAYTFLTTGSFVHPGYDYQYQLEANGYTTLGYNPAWSVEDARYIPHNLGIMFGALPVLAPDIKPDTLGFSPVTLFCSAPGATRALFDPTCPMAIPIDIGTSMLLSAPGLLLALFAIWRRPVARLTIGATTTVLVIAIFNLAHFSQGWVQWGYRFSLDFIPFLLPLVALGAARAGSGRPRPTAIVLLVAGAAVNLWGVTWGQLLGW